MKFNEVNKSREFEKGTDTTLVISGIVLAIIVGFILLIIFNAFSLLILLIIRYWHIALIVFLIFIFFRIRAKRKK